MNGNRTPYDGYPWDRDQTERFSVARDQPPWYLRRWGLALWGLAVVVLIAIIIYGLVILARGNGGSAPTPVPARPSTTASTTSTTRSTSPSTTPPTTTTSPEETTVEPAPTETWTPQPSRRHWWRSNLPPIPPIPHF